jgi:hypothetical protein
MCTHVHGSDGQLLLFILIIKELNFKKNKSLHNFVSIQDL